MSKESNEFDILEFAAKASKIIENNFKIALVIFVVAVAGGSAYVLKNKADANSEKEAFNELFAITKVYQDKKEGFDKAKAQAERKKAPKKDPKVPEIEEENLVQASGDMTKDFGEVVPKLEAFISSQKGKNASGEAALVLSEIYEDYKKPEKGAEVISKALSTWAGKGLLFQVLQLRAGDLWAIANDCNKAVTYWQKIATDKSFVSQQAQLKLGVCYQELGRLEEAKTWFSKIKSETPNSNEGFNAGRYLRYLQFKNKVPSSNEQSAQTKSDDNKS